MIFALSHTKAHSPDMNVNSPETYVHSPDINVHSPDINVHSPEINKATAMLLLLFTAGFCEEGLTQVSTLSGQNDFDITLGDGPSLVSTISNAALNETHLSSLRVWLFLKTNFEALLANSSDSFFVEDDIVIRFSLPSTIFNPTFTVPRVCSHAVDEMVECLCLEFPTVPFPRLEVFPDANSSIIEFLIIGCARKNNKPVQ